MASFCKMTNKFAGTCKRCGKHIPAGVQVVYGRFGSRGYIYHQDKNCAAHAVENQQYHSEMTFEARALENVLDNTPY